MNERMTLVALVLNRREDKKEKTKTATDEEKKLNDVKELNQFRTKE